MIRHTLTSADFLRECVESFFYENHVSFAYSTSCHSQPPRYSSSNQSDKTDKEWLSVADAMKKLDVVRSTIYTRLKRDELQKKKERGKTYVYG